MEVRDYIRLPAPARPSGLICLLVMLCSLAMAQSQVGKSAFRDNELYIEVYKNAERGQLEQFIKTYDLKELNLPEILRTNKLDTLRVLGWKIKLNSDKKLVIAKPLSGGHNLNNPNDELRFSVSKPDIARRFPISSNGTRYGYNQFRNKAAFAVQRSVTRFYLRNHLSARKVVLAGSFNDFSPEGCFMKKTDSGWIADVKLQAGKYWYKFVVDDHWITDEDNRLQENDEHGNTNSVYYQPNTLFHLKGHTGASRVCLAGNFNNWQKNEIRMDKTAEGWEIPIYLPQGTHTYKYVVDNRYYNDPEQPERLPDGHGGYNSVWRIGTSHLFKLAGYTHAGRVMLAGSFNDWRADELQMTKTDFGWQLPYTLGAGNYQYRFVIDGKWIIDPANPLTATTDGETNSYLIVGSNYQFRLKGMEKAKSVFVAGDFNNWTPGVLALHRQGNEWVCPVYLSPGKHTYKFIVDGRWITDPGNKDWEQNEFGTGNSVVWVGP